MATMCGERSPAYTLGLTLRGGAGERLFYPGSTDIRHSEETFELVPDDVVGRSGGSSNSLYSRRDVV